MEEQNELNDLKQLMERQQKTLTETMSAMELKATALQEKLDRRAELSSTNAEAGVKKIALEYKVVELKIEHKLPPGFGEPKPPPTPPPPPSFGAGVRFTNDPSIGHQPTAEADQPDNQAIIKECEEKARQRHREFEENQLKELGEEGWTLRSIDAVLTPVTSITKSYTKLFIFSRPM